VFPHYVDCLIKIIICIVLSRKAFSSWIILGVVVEAEEAVFWDVALCGLVIDQRFRGACCHHYQDDNGD
jgi:hypothetical protein